MATYCREQVLNIAIGYKAILKVVFKSVFKNQAKPANNSTPEYVTYMRVAKAAHVTVRFSQETGRQL